jgi:hypothetical protein
MKSSKLVLTGIAILMAVILLFTKLNGHRKQGRDTTTCIQQQGQLQNDSAEEIEVYPYSILANMPY